MRMSHETVLPLGLVMIVSQKSQHDVTKENAMRSSLRAGLWSFHRRLDMGMSHKKQSRDLMHGLYACNSFTENLHGDVTKDTALRLDLGLGS